MVEMNDLDSQQLIEAVRVWVGWGQMMPHRDDARLVRHVGNETAARLLPLVKLLEDDFYSSDARFVAADPQEMHNLASKDFRQKHPTIAGEIVDAFAWCYTFDFK